MGNKKNRTRGKKRKFPNLKNNNQNGSNPSSPIKTVALNVVSILCPTSDAEVEEHKIELDPIGNHLSYDPTTTVNNMDRTECAVDTDKVKTESDAEPETELKTKPETNESMNIDSQVLIAFKNKCRLCQSTETTTWINIFSNEPYETSDKITPFNILEIIEQFTTVKILKGDRLPDKLCSQCFLALRFMYNFREKSLLSKESLELALSESLKKPSQPQQNKIVKVIRLKPITKLLKNNHLKPIVNTAVTSAVTKPQSFDEYEEIYGKDSSDLQCEICGDVFLKKKLLQYHLNRHKGIKPFVCEEPYCEKGFFTPQNLKAHIQTVHCTEPKFKCDVENCNKVYNKAYKLKIHRTVHFPPTIPCKICGKNLRSQASVIKHRTSHQERKFKCDDCGKSFQTSYTLRTHQRIHTNEKPFICCKCGEAFTYNCMLKAHTEKYHPS